MSSLPPENPRKLLSGGTESVARWLFGGLACCLVICLFVVTIASVPVAANDLLSPTTLSTAGIAGVQANSELVSANSETIAEIGSATERAQLPNWILRDSAIALFSGLVGILAGVLFVRLRERSGGRAQETDGGSMHATTLTRQDEERICQLLRSGGGVMKQSEIVERTSWSKAKVSRTLSRMEASRLIQKERVGRQNVIRLVDLE